jgi:hypothetical protein
MQTFGSTKLHITCLGSSPQQHHTLLRLTTFPTFAQSLTPQYLCSFKIDPPQHLRQTLRPSIISPKLGKSLKKIGIVPMFLGISEKTFGFQRKK